MAIAFKYAQYLVLSATETAYLILYIYTCLGPNQLLDKIQVATLTRQHKSSSSFPLHIGMETAKSPEVRACITSITVYYNYNSDTLT